jgi:hypothetical protein
LLAGAGGSIPLGGRTWQVANGEHNEAAGQSGQRGALIQALAILLTKRLLAKHSCVEDGGGWSEIALALNA